MSCDGILDVHIEHESVNGDTFLNFVERNLLPVPYHLMELILIVL